MRTYEVTDRHLSHEERDVEPLIVPRMESAEWKAVQKQLDSAPPTIGGRFIAWVQDGMTPEGRAYFDSEIPRLVSFVFGRVFGRRYHREIAPVWRP